MTLRPLPSREEIHARLRLLFPPEVFDTVTSNPLAAAATAAMLYVGAVVPDSAPSSADSTWARPSVCLWLSDAAYARSTEQERSAWLTAAQRNRKRVAELLASWGESFEPWYADNMRETLRDETFPRWLDFGAMRYREGVKTTSSQPRWALTESFADVFHPELAGDTLGAAVESWREDHLNPGDLVRVPHAGTRRSVADLEGCRRGLGTGATG